MITEKVAYLANVMTIACADGRLSRREEGILQTVADRIGATESDIEQAKSILMRGDYRLVPLKVTSERLQNIEDMVLIAMADGALSGHETTPIERFTDALGLTQREMDAIVTRAQQRLRGRELEPTPRRTIRRRGPVETEGPRHHPRAPKPPPAPPPVPQAPPPPPVPPPVPRTPPPVARVPKSPPSVPRESRQSRRSTRSRRPPTPPKPRKKRPEPVTQQAPFVQATRPKPRPQKREVPRVAPRKPAFVPPSTGIVLTFAGIASDALQLALREAGSASEKGTYETTTTPWHYAVWPETEIRLAARCALAAAALANHAVYVNGRQQAWDDVFGFCPCALARMASDMPDAYCFGSDDEFLNIWGCRQARMDWSAAAHWFALGSFEGRDGFAFDKEAIWRLLQANLGRVAHCPFLDMARMKTALANLPDRIKARGRWRFREAQSESGVAETRMVNENIQGCVFSYETLVDGIAPNDEYDAIRLISRAAKAAGRPLPAAALKRGMGSW